jgi:hypothetical protein
MYHEQRMWVQSIDTSGEVNWEKEIVTNEDEAPTAADARLLETGQIRVWGLATRAPLAYVVDMDTTGQIEALKSIDHREKLSDATLTTMRCTADGGCLVTGEISVGPSQFKDLLLVKLSPAGDYEWQRTFGGSRWESGIALAELQNGSCAVAGVGDGGPESGDDAYLVWIDTTRDTLWEKRLPRNGVQSLSQVMETGAGNILVVGQSQELAEANTDSRIKPEQLWWAEFDQQGTLVRESLIGALGASISGRDVAINADGTWTILVNVSTSEFRSETLLLRIGPHLL